MFRFWTQVFWFWTLTVLALDSGVLVLDSGVLVLDCSGSGLTGGPWGTVADRILRTGLHGAGQSGGTGTAGAGVGVLRVSVESGRAGPVRRRLVSGEAVFVVRVAGGLTGAEGPARRVAAPEAGRAALAEIALVAPRTDAGLDPDRHGAGSTPGRHQLHVVQVTTS